MKQQLSWKKSTLVYNDTDTVRQLCHKASVAISSGQNSLFQLFTPSAALEAQEV